jgi:hypothetical protein
LEKDKGRDKLVKKGKEAMKKGCWEFPKEGRVEGNWL